MATGFKCPDKILCPSLDGNPLTNYSAEDPDPPIRLGYSTGTAPTNFGKGGSAGTGTGGNPPPIGSSWDNLTSTTIVEVTDPDVDPADEAGNANVDSLVDDTTPGSGGWKVPPPPIHPPTVYVNHPQTCLVNCPDGSPFSFTVPVGTFRSFSQADADRAAYSYACKQAQLNAICLGSISARACTGMVYNQFIVANSANIPVTFSIVDGSIPDWMTATVGPSSIHLTGTPDAGDIGDVAFTVLAVDAFGFSMSRAYAISVEECVEACLVTESTLPVFFQGKFYSAQLHATGGTAPYTWALVEGVLPTGLSLSTSGLISGTVTLVNGNLDQTFTVLATDSSTPAKQCEGTITLPIFDYHDFPPGKAWRIAGYVDGDLNSSCSGPVISGTVWDGSWPSKKASAWFRSSVPGEVNLLFGTPGGPFTGYGGKPYLGVGNSIGGAFTAPEWVLVVITFSSGTLAIWSGKKLGSNAGSKLDSPAGTYTYFDFGGTCAALPATLTVEDF